MGLTLGPQTGHRPHGGHPRPPGTPTLVIPQNLGPMPNIFLAPPRMMSPPSFAIVPGQPLTLQQLQAMLPMQTMLTQPTLGASQTDQHQSLVQIPTFTQPQILAHDHHHHHHHHHGALSGPLISTGGSIVSSAPSVNIVTHHPVMTPRHMVRSRPVRPGHRETRLSATTVTRHFLLRPLRFSQCRPPETAAYRWPINVDNLDFPNEHFMDCRSCTKKADVELGFRHNPSVCTDEDILKVFEHNICGELVAMPRDKWALKDDAVPRLFPNCLSYLSKPTRKRKAPSRRLSPAKSKRRKYKDVSSEAPVIGCDAYLTTYRSFKEGSLRHPSIKMLHFIRVVNESISFSLDEEGLCADLFWKVLDEFDECDLMRLGCDQHKPTFTCQVLYFFIVTRMHFYARDVNRRLQTREKVSITTKKARLL
ncbi:hypothetical protein HPB51_028117 [Rhipicephalus microplus]|uniref:Uncharacterized protein n=1 Tax=Rhipicephalus microplus TaxID=6941 RepID=A0A9J6CXY7_RHIMP|nr:hypothetical protein HPB51_028117 [Rhipicephalus microplus]